MTARASLCVLAAALIAGCGESRDPRTSDPDRGPAAAPSAGTRFTIDLPAGWRKPSPAFVKRFRAVYGKRTGGAPAMLRAIRPGPRGHVAFGVFETVEPSSRSATPDQLYDTMTQDLHGKFGKPARFRLDGSAAVAFQAAVPAGARTDEELVVLCPRDDRLVTLIFATVDAGHLVPARHDIDQMIASLRWRAA